MNVLDPNEIIKRLRQQVILDQIRVSLHGHGEMVEEDISYDQLCEALLNGKVIENYAELLTSENEIACFKYIKSADRFTLNSWLTNLLFERFEQKTEYFRTILSYTNNNWEEAFYIMLARNFGFKTNALPFELLAKTTPCDPVSFIFPFPLPPACI